MLALPFGDYRDTEQLCCDVISGGLNGGSLSVVVSLALIVNIVLSLVDLAESIGLIITSMAGLIAGAPFGTMIIAAVLVVVGIACSVFAVIEIGKSLWLYYRYINGDKSAGLELIENTAYNLLFTLLFVVGSSAAKHFLKNSVKKALYSIMGSDFVESMLKEFDDILALKKCVKQLQDMGFSVGVILELSDAFGKKGLDWLLSKKGLGLTDDLVRKIIKAGNLDWFTDDVIRAIINSNGYADDIIDLIKKYGKDAADAIGKYGDDAVEVFKKYGDDAVDGFKNGKTPDEIKADMDNVDSGGGSSGGGDTDTGGGTSSGDNGGSSSGTESGSNTRIFRDATQEDADLIDSIKTKYNAGKTRNAASAKGTINGQNIDLECISGQFTHDNYYNKGNFEPPQPENYYYIGPIPEYTNHTEQKIVEYLREIFKNNKQVSGTIEIISEREFCDNCKVVVDMFEEEFPNIKVTRVEVIK